MEFTRNAASKRKQPRAGAPSALVADLSFRPNMAQQVLKLDLMRSPLGFFGSCRAMFVARCGLPMCRLKARSGPALPRLVRRARPKRTSLLNCERVSRLKSGTFRKLLLARRRQKAPFGEGAVRAHRLS